MSRIENTPGVPAGSVGAAAQPQQARPAQSGPDFAAALLAALKQQQDNTLLAALQDPQDGTDSAGLTDALGAMGSTDATDTVGATSATEQLLRWLAAGINPGDDVRLLLGLADLPASSMSGLSLLDRAGLSNGLQTGLPAGADGGLAVGVTETAAGGVSGTAAAAPAEGVSLARLGPQERFQALKPYFLQAEMETGVPWQIQAAQWALETGWGRSTPRDVQSGRESYNLFGIKGEGPAGSVSAMTTEVVNGMRVTQVARFRAYGSYAESIVDHARLLTGPYYAKAHAAGGDLAKWTEMLGPKGLGYATDPQYSGKLLQIIRENGWDRQA